MDSSFDESLVKFRRFLRENGYPEKVVWLMPKDVLLSGRRLIYVRVPIPRTNETLACELFALSVSQGRGVLFKTICTIEDTTYAFAWSPKDEDEAEQRQIGNGLKMSVVIKSSMVAGETVNNMLRWLYLRLRLRGKQMHRAELFC